MSGRHKWSELRKNYSPERLRAIEIETEKLRIEWGLPEIPEEYEMTDDDICWPNTDPDFVYDWDSMGSEAADDD